MLALASHLSPLHRDGVCRVLRYECGRRGGTVCSGSENSFFTHSVKPIFIKHLLCARHRVDARDTAVNKTNVVSALPKVIVMLSVMRRFNLQIWFGEQVWNSQGRLPRGSDIY